MPDSQDPHVDRIVDRDLREVIGGDAPPRELRARVRRAIQTRATASAIIRDADVVVPTPPRAPHTPSRPMLVPTAARRGRTARRSTFPAAGITVAATLLLIAALAIALSLIGSNRRGPIDGNAGPVVIVPGRGDNAPPEFNANNNDRAAPDSPSGNSTVANNGGANDAGTVNNRANTANANRIDPRNDGDNRQPNNGVVERPDTNATPTNNSGNGAATTDNGNESNSAGGNNEATDPGEFVPNTNPSRRVATVVGISRGDTLTANASAECTVGATVHAPTELETKGVVDLELLSGALLRFDGRVRLDIGVDVHPDDTVTLRDLRVDLIDDQLYLDNARGRVPVSVVRTYNDQQILLSIADGVALVESKLSGFDVACIDGSVEIRGAGGNDTIYAGERASVTIRGVGSRRRVDDDIYRERFFRDLPARVLARETFDNETRDPEARQRWLDSGMYTSTGTLDGEAGWMRGSRSSTYVLRVELGIEPELLSAPHTYIRVRYRFSSDTPLKIAGFSSSLGEHVDLQCDPAPANTWTTATVLVSAMTLRIDRNTHYSPDFPIDLLKFYPKDDTDDLTFEIDTLELLRIPQQ